MSIFSRLFNRARASSLTREFDEEIQSHLDRRTEHNIRAGMSAEAARTEARRHFGSVTQAREGMREARMTRWIDDLIRDVRHGARVFGRQPLLTAFAVLTLSLGIGANAAIFSVLNAVIFRPLPFPDSERLVGINMLVRTGGGRSPTIPEVLDIRVRQRTLDAISFFDTRDVQIDGGAEPVRIFAARVDPALFPLMGVRPAAGRLFVDTDSQDGSPPVILLGDGFWRRNFGADPAAVGRTLNVNGTPTAIVGVLGSNQSLNFASGQPIDAYVPYPLNSAYTSRAAEFANVRGVQTVGRVKRGVAPSAVSADLSSILTGLMHDYPEVYRQTRAAADTYVDVQPMREGISEAARPLLFMLFGAVTVVLLIACLNGAQFLLVQAIEREPEVALRGALGARRGRLIRQFLSETLMLVTTAGAFGLLLGYWLVRGLRLVLPAMLMVGEIEIDLPVLLFVAAIALGTTIFCGLLPSLRFSRARLNASMATRMGTRARTRSRQLFVTVQVALSLVLLVEAGLLLRSLQILRQSQAGFSAANVTVMRIRGMGAGPTLGLTYQRFLEQLASIAGLEDATITSGLVPGFASTPFTVLDPAPDAAASVPQNSTYQIVSPGFFNTLRIPLREGRSFAPTDAAGSPPVAVVNEELARRYWPGASAIGHRLRAGVGPREQTMTIVGVVGNVRPMARTEDIPQVYVSFLQQAEPNMSVLVRSRPGASVTLDAVKAAIWSVEPRQAVFGVQPLDTALSGALQGLRVLTFLIGCFAGLAFVMSVTGIFAVISYVTSRRVKEIALRRAIGAQGSDVVWLLAGPTFRWTLFGLVIGAGGAVFAATALRAIVPSIVALSPPLIGVVAVIYLGVVALAMVFPAMRALRIDPASALRAE